MQENWEDITEELYLLVDCFAMFYSVSVNLCFRLQDTVNSRNLVSKNVDEHLIPDNRGSNKSNQLKNIDYVLEWHIELKG